MYAIKSHVSFAEGIEEICGISPSIKDIIAREDGTLPTDYIEVVQSIMNKVNADIPTINSTEYPATSAFSVSAREVGYKFPGQLSFGWRVMCKNDDENITYSFRISIASNPVIAKSTDVMKKANELGFNLREETRHP